MTESDLKELYGAPLYRVDYVCNGQPASHAAYRTGEQTTFMGFNVVDGVVTELEDLGRMPDDPSSRAGNALDSAGSSARSRNNFNKAHTNGGYNGHAQLE